MAKAPKLSGGGGRRAPCIAGGKAAPEARAVTAGAVRCSAWSGGLVLRKIKKDSPVIVGVKLAFGPVPFFGAP